MWFCIWSSKFYPLISTLFKCKSLRHRIKKQWRQHVDLLLSGGLVSNVEEKWRNSHTEKFTSIWQDCSYKTGHLPLVVSSTFNIARIYFCQSRTILKTCQCISLQSILHEQAFPLVVTWGNTVFGVFSVILPLQENSANPKLQSNK